MSLNNISFSSQQVAELYQHTLVSSNATAMPQKPPVPFLGEGGKNILILVNQPDSPYLPDKELAFLTKVLSACQLGLRDVAIVNWSKAPHKDGMAMMEQVKATSVILFDVDAALFGLPEQLPPFTVHAKQNRQFVAAPALQEIEKTKETKSQLWTALKQLFCI